MLTISKPLSAGQAQTYHAKDFTAKEQNYWSQTGVIQGDWQGKLAARFGLAGAVSAADFLRLSQGQHPETGEQLVRQRASHEYQVADGKTVKTMEHRAGWDATFSAPKSVSLTALVGGDDCVRDAHRESVQVALEQLETTPRRALAEIMPRKLRPDSSLRNSNTIPPGPWMVMWPRNSIRTPSFSISQNVRTANIAPCSRRACLPPSNWPPLFTSPN